MQTWVMAAETPAQGVVQPPQEQHNTAIANGQSGEAHPYDRHFWVQ